MKITLSSILFFGLIIPSFAQELIPLPYDFSRKIIHKTIKNGKSGESLDTISLPFIDDFFTSKLTPDTARFLSGGGIFINNNFAVNPPSFNVATFDGLDENGTPYNESNPFDRGLCDVLTSQAINLQGANNVYMSFWWQAQGNAVPQISADSIQLSLLDTAGNWQVVWYETGQLQADFIQEMIEITPEYLHQGFQFKFESFGNRTGMFGVWNIDYIYIDDNRTLADSTLNDMAMSKLPSSYLANYWAMPKDQFFANPTAEIAPSAVATFNNFKLNLPAKLPYLIDTQADEFNLSNGDSNNIGQSTNLSVDVLAKQIPITGVNTNFLTNGNGDIIIKNKFRLDAQDQQIGDTVNGVIVDFSTTQNDTLSSYTTLSNYYAYDDGSAEQAFRVTTQDAIVLQEFTINKKDTIYGVAIYFPGNPYQYDSTQLVLMVWQEATGGYNVNDILYDERVLISVADSINGFTYYNFLEPVVVSNKFYIGYKQDGTDDILIGYDINSSPLEPIHFFITDTWKQFSGPGVLMIRPLMEHYSLASVTEKKPKKFVKIFPNPANDRLYFSSLVAQIQLVDLTGKVIYSERGRLNTIDLSQFENGVYFITLQNEDGVVQREKLIITK